MFVMRAVTGDRRSAHTTSTLASVSSNPFRRTGVTPNRPTIGASLSSSVMPTRRHASRAVRHSRSAVAAIPRFQLVASSSGRSSTASRLYRIDSFHSRRYL
jgi:hypothetical protein